MPPLVPPELDIEAWRESIAKIRALAPAKLYLPHFGLVAHDISTHLDALEECLVRWSIWVPETAFCAGDNEQKMTVAFTDYVAGDLEESGRH